MQHNDTKHIFHWEFSKCCWHAQTRNLITAKCSEEIHGSQIQKSEYVMVHRSEKTEKKLKQTGEDKKQSAEIVSE